MFENSHVEDVSCQRDEIPVKLASDKISDSDLKLQQCDNSLRSLPNSDTLLDHNSSSQDASVLVKVCTDNVITKKNKSAKYRVNVNNKENVHSKNAKKVTYVNKTVISTQMRLKKLRTTFSRFTQEVNATDMMLAQWLQSLSTITLPKFEFSRRLSSGLGFAHDVQTVLSEQQLMNHDRHLKLTDNETAVDTILLGEVPETTLRDTETISLPDHTLFTKTLGYNEKSIAFVMTVFKQHRMEIMQANKIMNEAFDFLETLSVNAETMKEQNYHLLQKESDNLKEIQRLEKLLGEGREGFSRLKTEFLQTVSSTQSELTRLQESNNELVEKLRAANQLLNHHQTFEVSIQCDMQPISQQLVTKCQDANIQCCIISNIYKDTKTEEEEGKKVGDKEAMQNNPTIADLHVEIDSLIEENKCLKSELQELALEKESLKSNIGIMETNQQKAREQEKTFFQKQLSAIMQEADKKLQLLVTEAKRQREEDIARVRDEFEIARDIECQVYKELLCSARSQCDQELDKERQKLSEAHCRISVLENQVKHLELFRSQLMSRLHDVLQHQWHEALHLCYENQANDMKHKKLDLFSKENFPWNEADSSVIMHKEQEDRSAFTVFLRQNPKQSLTGSSHLRRTRSLEELPDKFRKNLVASDSWLSLQGTERILTTKPTSHFPEINESSLNGETKFKMRAASSSLQLADVFRNKSVHHNVPAAVNNIARWGENSEAVDSKQQYLGAILNKILADPNIATGKKARSRGTIATQHSSSKDPSVNNYTKSIQSTLMKCDSNCSMVMMPPVWPVVTGVSQNCCLQLPVPFHFHPCSTACNDSTHHKLAQPDAPRVYNLARKRLKEQHPNTQGDMLPQSTTGNVVQKEKTPPPWK